MNRSSWIVPLVILLCAGIWHRHQVNQEMVKRFLHEQVFIGDALLASSRVFYTRENISHVLTLAPTTEVDDAIFPSVPWPLIRLRLQPLDNGRDNFDPYIDQANRFIESARLEKGRILIHCVEGKSRSASFFMYVTPDVKCPRFNHS